MLGSVSMSNVTVNAMVPSLALVDCMYSMSSTPFICCSSGVATDCSTVTASAPVKVPLTMIWGGMIDGYCATGRLRIASRPAGTVMIEMTIATMGRPVKKPATVLTLRRGLERHGRDRRAVSHFLHAFGHDLLVGRQAVLDHPHHADAGSDLDRPDRHLVVLAHDGDLVAPLQLGDRALRHQQRALRHPESRAHPSELPRSQDVPRVRERRRDPDRTGRRIDLAIRQHELAGPGIHRSLPADGVMQPLA